MHKKRILNKNNNSKKNQKGFTLIEVLVATFVFVLIMTASAGIFVSMVTAIRKSRDLQRNVEGAQLALNEIPKTLRTSVVKDAPIDGSSITVFDNSRGLTMGCIKYEYDSAAFLIRRGESSDTEANCSPSSIFAYSSMLDTYVADFKLKFVDGGVGGVGRATISALVCNQVPCTAQSEKVYIQSSVSIKSGT